MSKDRWSSIYGCAAVAALGSLSSCGSDVGSGREEGVLEESAESAEGAEGAEGADGEAESAGALARGWRSSCQVSPAPVVGRDLTVSISGVAPGSRLGVRIRDALGTDTIETTAGLTGSATVTHMADAPGSGKVFVYVSTRGRYVLSTTCTFDVADVTLPPGCVPLTCGAIGGDCGVVQDGCGGTIDCGDCAPGQICGGGASRCGPAPCLPTSCAAAGAECGAVADGCGGLLECGVCDVGLICGANGVANHCSEQAAPTWPAAWADFEEQVLSLLNARRAAGATCGTTVMAPVGPLTVDSALRDAARLHSKDMADQDYFSHTSLDGRSPWTRIADAGWQGMGSLAENIAAGQTTPAAVVNSWMQSSGHCLNLMSSNFNRIGVGYAQNSASTYRHYWTTDFGRL